MPSSQYEKILFALLGLERIQKDTIPLKKKVMGMCQIKASSFAPVVSRMAKEGLVANGSAKGTLQLSEVGRARALVQGGGDLPSCNEEVHEAIKEKVKGAKMKRIVDYLSDGQSRTRAAIMKHVDIANEKTFGQLLSRELRKLGYIDYPAKNMVCLNVSCFPFGRPGAENDSST